MLSLSSRCSLVLLLCHLAFSPLLKASETYHQQKNFRILLTENPSAIERHGAQELKLFLGKIYGERVISFSGAKSQKPLTFLVGFSAAQAKKFDGFADAIAFQKKLDSGTKGGFGVFRHGSTFVFLGKDAKNFGSSGEFVGKSIRYTTYDSAQHRTD